MWQLHDNTYGKHGGYLSILRDGVRVCDAFPFSAPHTKEHEQFVREQTQRIVDTMNKKDMLNVAHKSEDEARKMTDIVERLRAFGPEWPKKHNNGAVVPYEICETAANEIERLRKVEEAGKTLSLQMRDDVLSRQSK